MSIWTIPVYLPYVQPDLTDAVVAAAEQELGVRLPSSYVALLREQNGGYLARTSHPSGHAPVRDIFGIGPNFPSILGRDWSEAKEYMAENGITTPRDIDRLIAFSGDGHYFYCFDYRHGGEEPRVTYIDVETFDHDEELAPDFATFLAQLYAESSDEYGLVTDLPGKQIKAALEEASGLKFVDAGDQDHGYQTYRAKLPGDAAWAWLTANHCRRGFVRKGERNYAKLSKRMPEIVPRHPEHADCGYFLSTNVPESTAGEALVQSLSKLPFPVRAVRLSTR